MGTYRDFIQVQAGFHLFVQCYGVNIPRSRTQDAERIAHVDALAMDGYRKACTSFSLCLSRGASASSAVPHALDQASAPCSCREGLPPRIPAYHKCKFQLP